VTILTPRASIFKAIKMQTLVKEVNMIKKNWKICFRKI